MRTRKAISLFLLASVVASMGHAQTCPGTHQIQNYTGGGTTSCPCFIQGEEAGSIFTLAPSSFPIQITRVGIGWGSQFGGRPQSLEQAIHVYEGGLPDPGTPILSLLGPQLTDGFINEFDLESSNVFVTSSPFTVTLEFQNTNAGDPFRPSVAHDGNGCQPGKNIVKADPGGWADACDHGVSGDWIFRVTYRCEETVGVVEVVSPNARILHARPNPFRASSEVGFSLASNERATIVVYDPAGRALVTLTDGILGLGAHVASWNGRDAAGRPVPPGVCFVELRTRTGAHAKKIVRTQ